MVCDRGDRPRKPLYQHVNRGKSLVSFGVVDSVARLRRLKKSWLHQDIATMTAAIEDGPDSTLLKNLRRFGDAHALYPLFRKCKGAPISLF